MGVINTPKPFEIFLASLMSERDAAAALYERAGLSVEAVAEINATEAAAGFWTPGSITYFEDRLSRTGIDESFVVALSIPPGTLRHRFALQAWPEFELGVLVDSASVPFYPHFVRQPETTPTPFTDVRTIRPWSATIEETLAWLGPPLLDDSWDLRRWLTYAIASEEWIVTFDLGLVQNAHRKSTS